MARNRLHAGIVIVAFLAVAFVGIPLVIKEWIWDGPGSDEWQFWLQTVAGNWSPTPKPPITHWAYAFSATLAVLLNNALIVAVVTLVWRRIVEGRTLMRLAQVLAAKDAMSKQALFKKLSDDPDTIQRINAAFEEGEEDWKRHLESVFGKEDAGRVFMLLGKEI